MPSTLRAARPMVWISDVSLRRKPSLSASRIATSAHSGMSRPSRSRLMPTSASNAPSRRSRMISMRSMRVDVGMHVAHADALLVQVFGEVLGHALGQHGDQRAVAGAARSARTSPTRSSTCVRAGPDVDRRIDQPGRADHLLDEHAAGLRRSPSRPASPTPRRSAAASRPIPRSAAAGCPCRRAGGSRIRRASPCGGSRRDTCRRAAAR